MVCPSIGLSHFLKPSYELICVSKAAERGEWVTGGEEVKGFTAMPVLAVLHWLRVAPINHPVLCLLQLNS